MARGPRRVKVGATLDPELVAAVDRYVASHPDLDRSGVIDEALRLWYSEQQTRAMERGYLAQWSPREVDEGKGWVAIRRAATERMVRGRQKWVVPEA